MNTQLIATWNTADPTEPAILPNGHQESPRAHTALLDYLRLGPGRTLQALLQHYQQQASAPTGSHNTLRKWSCVYDWPARAARYDTLADERLQVAEQARRAALLERGLSLEYERIDQLGALYARLKALIADEESFWVKSVRLLRYPDGSFERVELRRFNEGLMRQLRGLLDDLASETGGRPIRYSVLPAPPAPAETGPKPEDYSLDDFSPEELAEFIRLENKFFSNPVKHEK